VDKHHPTWIDVVPNTATRLDVRVPGVLNTGYHVIPSCEDQDSYYEISEWLDLVILDSPQTMKSKSEDQYISRYSIPEGASEYGDLRIARWQGLLSANWVTNLLITTMWVAYNIVIPDICALYSPSLHVKPRANFTLDVSLERLTQSTGSLFPSQHMQLKRSARAMDTQLS